MGGTKPGGSCFFSWARWVSAEGSGEKRTGLGRSAEARSEEEGTGACFGKQKALLSGPGIGLLIFSSTNLEMNLIKYLNWFCINGEDGRHRLILWNVGCNFRNPVMQPGRPLEKEGGCRMKVPDKGTSPVILQEKRI
jgi:hypothetical protein